MASRAPWGRPWLYGVLATLAIAGVIALTVPRQGASRSANGAPDTGQPVPGPSKSVAGHRKPEVESVDVAVPATANLTPVDVIGNPDCVMKPGARQGRGLAMVVVPGVDGSRFAVVDDSGVVFADTLPFPAVRDSSHARREDGSVLAGFGGGDVPPRRGSPFRRSAAPFGAPAKGVVVYQDGQSSTSTGRQAGSGWRATGRPSMRWNPWPGGCPDS
ncbi:MAG: hypothetical protein OXL38_11445 [Gammaproteobacteria bacterium]|nr:hypothetical protein [Gammaproteobacteria bacterium]